MIIIDIQKAKEIFKQKIRIERIPFLEELDIMFIRALENNDIDKQQKIIQKKQYLRDIPNHPSINNATSIEQLKSLNLLSGINIYE